MKARGALAILFAVWAATLHPAVAAAEEGPHGLTVTPFSTPSGYTISVETFWVAVAESGVMPRRTCVEVLRMTDVGRIRTLHSEWGCIDHRTGYNFDPMAWTGSLKVIVPTVKFIERIRDPEGSHTTVSIASRASRVRLDLRWEPAGKIRPAVQVVPGFCYGPPFVCPRGQAGLHRTVRVGGAVAVEGFSLFARMPKSAGGTAYILTP